MHGPQLFVQAVNEMIDSQGWRADILARHVPELVLLLLLGTFPAVGLIIGYAAGAEATHRPASVTYPLVLLDGRAGVRHPRPRPAPARNSSR